MALTPDEIEAWMYRSLDSSHKKYANLIYYYKLNQSSGATVMDEKGSCDGAMINWPTITGLLPIYTDGQLTQAHLLKAN
jgi:hypothetical protein